MSSHENDAWFSREIEKLGPTLFRVAFAILRNRTDCEDAAQNAVLKAYRNLGSLKQRSYFKTWLISILKNECFDMLKRRRPALDVDGQSNLSYEMTVPDMDLNRQARGCPDPHRNHRPASPNHPALQNRPCHKSR